MTMARINDSGDVVEVGIPEELKDATSGRLHYYGWRPLKGLPKPTDGAGYEYTAPYIYNEKEDAVYGTWQNTDVKERIWREARESAKLTRAEFKLALLEINELDNVKTAMEASNADPRAVILWEDALHFHRTDPDLLRLANDLGYTDEQLDKLFGISS